MLGRGVVAVVGAQHADDLGNQGVVGDPGDVGDGGVALGTLLDREVGLGQRGDLRQVGDADDLPGVAQPAQPLADRAGGGAADAGVDLVEDDRALRLARQAGKGEHDPRDLAARRRLAERRERHSRIRRHEQLDRLGPGRPEAVRMRLERHLEPRAVHRQLGELGGDLGREPFRRRGPPGAELGGERGAPHLALGDPGPETGAHLLRVLEPRDLGAATLGVRGDELDRAAVLALQAVERGQPLLDLLEPARIGLDAVEVGAQLGGDVGDLEPERRDPRGDRIERGVDALDRRQPALGGRERSRGALLVVVGSRERGDGAQGALAQTLGVAEASALGLEAGLLNGIGLGGIDLGELEAEHVELAFARALAGAKLGELAVERHNGAVRLAIGRPRREVLLAGEPVEDLELRRAEGQPPVLVLAVEGEQAAAEGAEVGGRGRPPGDEGARAARDADPTAEDDLVSALREPVADLLQLGVVEQAVGNAEHALDPGLVGARPDDLRARLTAHQEVERVREHRLSGSRLARDRVETVAEAQLGALDQQQVLDPELVEHAPVFSGHPRRIRPATRRCAVPIAAALSSLMSEAAELVADPPVEVRAG